ncbi:MAG TPA: nitrogen regulation protein NR(I) [Steroidobacteraceae bacterium]|nr:nitrogen regulation protein NR(I) [Steroidobacteraceae bacterium]
MSAAPLRVWLVDDDTSIRWVLERALKNGGMLPKAFDAAEPALAALRSDAPDVLITDIRMSGQSGLELLRRIHAVHPDLPIIVMTAYSDLGNAVSAYESGAFEYLPKPFDIDQAVDLVRRAASAASAANAAAHATNGAAAGVGARGLGGPQPRIAALLGRAPAMQQVFRAIGRLSRSSVNVLITGESGTGKELAARALHEHSPRASKPFIALNTSAIPAELLESELFGHEKGAFTGADALRRGRFEQADGGSLFLDEIGDMSTSLQTRLLRVLAEGEFYRVGGQTPIRVDVRVIAATHQNLEERVRTGLFREDLFHRLNVIRIELPPLRSRREDIADLLVHYLGVAAQELGVDSKALSAEARERLIGYGWPGNVRELVNLCRRLTVLAPGSEIRIEDLPSEPGSAGAVNANDEDWTAVLAQWADQQAHALQRPLLEDAMPAFERTLIRVALKHTQGHRQEAARLLGWGRNTLTRKLKELGMGEPGED